ncbi:MAG: hypothetical protein LBR26_01500 [Prevotella sp.]|jgi:hypothetical protein|nr:hypothetical protein [Prevotella sp.]
MANFSDDKVLAIWNKAAIVSEDKDNGKEWRKDPCGAWINFKHYGKQDDYGWEIDHALPEVKGGTDHTENLHAMHWMNNRSKADDFPFYKTAISSEGSKNIENENQSTLHESVLSKLKELYPNNQYVKNL